jgi:capsular polysaccharide biosynthesis protein
MAPFRCSLETINDLSELITAGAPMIRREIAPPAGRWRRVPLIPGTEAFSNAWLPTYHGQHDAWIRHGSACYSVLGARISGMGQIWLNDRLITAPDVMPPYVAEALDIAHGGSDPLWADAALPVRQIDVPCLVAAGHGVQVYGHFVMEMLLRILEARDAFGAAADRFHILLPRQSPAWLLAILDHDLGIGPERIVFFDPEREQVLLRHAILPTLMLQDGGFHPVANRLIDSFLATLDLAALAPTPRRVFAVRRRFQNEAAPYRICQNEERLVAIAAERHGFVPVAMESLSWQAQIAHFREADIVLGLIGSALHTALFAKPGSRLASLGVMNFTQSDIGVLRRQYNAFLADGVPVSGDFTIDEDRFTAFLDAVCNWPGAPPPPAQP